MREEGFEEIIVGDSLIGFRDGGGSLLPLSVLSDGAELLKNREVLPAGSIRQFKDGYNYKKVASGKWVRVGEGRKGSASLSTAGGSKGLGDAVSKVAYHALAPSTMVQSYGESYAHVRDPKLLLDQFLSSDQSGRLALQVMQKMVLINKMSGSSWFSAVGAAHMNKVTKGTITLLKAIDGYVGDKGDLLMQIHKVMDDNNQWKKFNKFHWSCLLRANYSLYLEKLTKYGDISRVDYDHLSSLFLIPKRGDIYEQGKIKSGKRAE